MRSFLCATQLIFGTLIVGVFLFANVVDNPKAVYKDQRRTLGIFQCAPNLKRFTSCRRANKKGRIKRPFSHPELFYLTAPTSSESAGSP